MDAFANANKETQGKFTIGDEKKHNVFMRPQVSSAWFGGWGVGLGADDEVGPRDPKGYGGDGSCRYHDQVEGDEEQFQVSAISCLSGDGGVRWGGTPLVVAGWWRCGRRRAENRSR